MTSSENPKAPHAARFERNATGYARFRPSYPQALLKRLVDAIDEAPATTDLVVADIGCGTGIFTRQLAETIPAMPVVGVEPAAAMIAEARATESPGNVRYVLGSAEHTPFPDAGCVAVTAATAAHWFDRPLFYAEARRVLVQGGVLAIVEYMRDTAGSPATAALENYLRRFEQKAYDRPDYASEFAALDGFGSPAAWTDSNELQLTPDDFVGLALSSSHSRAAVEAQGEEKTRAELEEIAAGQVGADGQIAYRYLFRLFTAVRT